MEDIDFLRRTLAVTRQVQRAGRGQVEVRPPEYGSERVVFLAPGLVEMLAAHVAGHHKPLNCDNRPDHTLKRNSTTSPSAMT